MNLFEEILKTNLINFLIVLSTIILIIKKIKAGELIQKLADDVRNSVEKSATDAQTALSEYKTTKKATKDTPKLQEEIIAAAQNNAQELKEKMEQKTLSQKEEIKDNLEKSYVSQNEKIKKLTTDEIYNACVDISQEEVISRLNPELHKKLINSSINELDEIEGSLL